MPPFLRRAMPKSERESLLLALSWQIVQSGGTKGNGASGQRHSHSIGGFLDGCQRSPRKFVIKATTKAEDEEFLPLPLFALSIWGITPPEPPSKQQPLQPDGLSSTIEQLGSEPPPARSRSTASQPSVSAFKEAESFFGNSYRPLVSKVVPPVKVAGGSPTSDVPHSAAAQCSSTSSGILPHTADKQIDPNVQISRAFVSDLPATQQQQKNQVGRRRSGWAKQLDAVYLQSLRDIQGPCGGVPSALSYKVNLEYAMATSTSSSTTAILAAAALPSRSPPQLYQSASLRLRQPSAAARPFLPPSASASSWWGIIGSGSDDRVSQQLLQRAMLNSQGSLRGKSIQQWWSWWYSVNSNACAQGQSSGAAAPRTLHVGWGVSPDVAMDIIKKRLERIQPNVSSSPSDGAATMLSASTLPKNIEDTPSRTSFDISSDSESKSDYKHGSGGESSRVSSSSSSSSSSSDFDSDDEVLVTIPAKKSRDQSFANPQPARRRVGACFKIALSFSNVMKEPSLFEEPFSEITACSTSDFYAEERTGAEYEFWSTHWQLPEASHGAIVFEAKARNDVYVVFSRSMHSQPQRLGPFSPAYEICIGGWNNTTSLIRRGAQGNTMIESDCTLPSRDFTKWWVSLNRSTCRVAVGLGSVPGMNVQFWAWDEKFVTDLNFFSFSCWDAAVEFRSIGTCAVAARVAPHAADRHKIVLHERFDKTFASNVLCGQVRGNVVAISAIPAIPAVSEVVLNAKNSGHQGSFHKSRAETAIAHLSVVLSNLTKVPTGCIRCEPFKRKADGSSSGREAWKNLLSASLKEKEEDQRLGGSNLDLRRQLAATGFIMAPTAARRKRVVVQRSPIHNLGLFARERIDKGALVIEYTGELLRSKLADFRERKYLGMGLESFYLFRLDEEYVHSTSCTQVDGTMKGSSARFINHSCNGNTVVKIIKAGSSCSGMRKCITFYSIRVIEIGEEITVDYKLKPEPEEQRIPCLCKAENCRLFLN